MEKRGKMAKTEQFLKSLFQISADFLMRQKFKKSRSKNVILRQKL
jgi:hypothetical protein